MKRGTQPMVGVCSWSLQAGDPDRLVERVQAVGLSSIQLALEPLRLGRFDPEQTVRALSEAGIEVRSGMLETAGEDYSSLESIRETGGLRSDELWPRNLAALRESARLARDLELGLVTFHAGFLPHDPEDPLRAVMLDRLRQVADVLEEQRLRLGLETGQESAGTLLAVLNDLDRPGVGVNFDPANLILYGLEDPIEAFARLAPRVVQVHIKDAVRAKLPGQWGQEVPVGQGQVDWARFFEIYREQGLDCDLMIEREAGESRVADIRTALRLVEARIA
jgi:sugar phosphate isomerase/epimerase